MRYRSVRQSKVREVSVLMAMISALLFSVAPASAAVHDTRITEIYPGSPQHPNAQFVEIQAFNQGQNLTHGHQVSVYNSAGAKTGSFTFDRHVANSTDDMTVLVGTAEAESVFGGVKPDLTMTPVLAAEGGKVCFDGPHPDDCVAWGNYSGSATGVGTPFNASEGLVLGASIFRKTSGGSDPGNLDAGDDTDDSALDFALGGAPSPKNNPGLTGASCCTVGFSAASYSAAEDGGSISISVTRTPSTGTLTTDYFTSNGSAVAGADYTAASGTLSFADGEASKSFSVSILDDAIDEYDESVKLSLRNPSVGVFSRVQATLNIVGELATTVPSAPENLTSTAGPGQGQISLSWSPPAADGGLPLTNYRIRTWRGTNTSGPTARITTLKSNVTSYTEGGLSPGTIYSFTVSAINELGEGPRSATASAQTFAAPPSAPQNLIATPNGLGSTILRWSPPSTTGGGAITAYRIYRGARGQAVFVYQQEGTATTYVDTSCPLTSVCFYQVTAVNSAGEGPRSNEAFMAGTA